MIEIEKKFLNTCFKKYTHGIYTQEEFAKGITDKYMISRLFHGYTTKDYIYDKLLKRLNLYYHYDEDIAHCTAIASSLLLSIETDNRESIQNLIYQLDTVIALHEKHVYFEELKFYTSLLSMHYIKEESIDIVSMDFSTLSFMSKPFRIAILHTICENLLFNAKFNELASFYDSYYNPCDSHFLLHFWKMVIEQGNKKTIEAYDIYRNHMYRFIENNDSFNISRFLIVYIQGDIRKHPDSVLEHLHHLEQKFIKNQYPYKYKAMIPYIYSILHIRNHDYEKAYSYILEGMHFTYMQNVFLPYYIVLSILLEKEIDENKFINSNSLNHICINLYNQYMKKAYRNMLKLVIREFPRVCCENPYFETMMILLKALVLQLSKQTRSYKSVATFYDEYQKYNKNYYM